MKLTLENVQKLLVTNKLDVQSQKETGQLYYLLKIQDAEFPVFVRLYDQEDLLQMLMFIPCTLANGSEGEVGRLLHTLNKEIDIPGFGMDETSRVIFYRAMVPAFKGEIEEGLIEAFLASLPTVGRTFGGVISAVATGNAKYEEVMKKVREAEKSQ